MISRCKSETSKGLWNFRENLGSNSVGMGNPLQVRLNEIFVEIEAWNIRQNRLKVAKKWT